MGQERNAEKAEEVYKELLSDFKGSEYPTLAKDLLEDKKKLNDLSYEFIRKVKDFISIPILPKECKYIKQSIGP